MSADVLELALLRRLAAGFRRSPLQLNAHQESDAELVRLPGQAGVLAVTTDSLAEEIESGLYDDPFRIGWMAVLAHPLSQIRTMARAMRRIVIRRFLARWVWSP